MPERKGIIVLGEREIQMVEATVLDGNGGSVLAFLQGVLKPAMDKELNRAHCKPTFEWETGEDLRPSVPPESL